MASDSSAPDEQLLMVVYPIGQAKRTVVRTINELRSPGEINHCIPYRPLCGYALLQGWLAFFTLWQLFKIQFIYENTYDVDFFVKVMN